MSQTSNYTGPEMKAHVTKPLTKPELQAKALDLEKRIKERNKEHQEFNEQQHLYNRLHGTIYEGFIHQELAGIFFSCRYGAAPASFGDRRQDYFKLMSVSSLEGLTYHEMAQVLNFIDTLSPEVIYNKTFGALNAKDPYDVIMVVEKIYQEMAIEVWNKQINIWREEIANEKQAIAEEVGQMVKDLNQIHHTFTEKKNFSRKERKEQTAKK